MANLKKDKKVYKHASAVLGNLYQPSDILSENNKVAYEQVSDAFVENQSVALVQATGTRKTSIAIQWIVDSLKEGEKAIFFALIFLALTSEEIPFYPFGALSSGDSSQNESGDQGHW